jgi:glycosyltransferase involved in cell wall biosynthesis
MPDSRPIRVARVIARLNVGGPARHVVWLTAGLAPRFETTLIAGTVPAGEEEMTEFARAAGVEPVVVGEMTRAISWRDAIVIWKLYRLFRSLRPDIVHTHTAKAGTVGRIAALLYRWRSSAKPRLVHTFHGHVFHGYYGRVVSALFIAIERVLARFTDAICVLSPAQLEEIHGRFRIGRREQFRIVPLGLDFAMLDEPAALPPRDAPFVAGIVGRLTEVKEHDFFLRAVAAWIAANPSESTKVKFQIIGDGHLRERLEQQARALGIASHVVFLGNRDDPAVFYRALDLLVLTSRNEGTPLTVIEAMALGIPILATEVGGVPDLLGELQSSGDGVKIVARGVMIARGDVAAFGAALSRLLRDPELRAALGAAGREHARTRYSKERLLRDMAALYGELVGFRAGA